MKFKLKGKIDKIDIPNDICDKPIEMNVSNMRLVNAETGEDEILIGDVSIWMFSKSLPFPENPLKK